MEYSYVLKEEGSPDTCPHGVTLRASCRVKEANTKGEMLSDLPTGWSSQTHRDRSRRLVSHGAEFSTCQMESSGCRMMVLAKWGRLYVTPLKCTLENGSGGEFDVMFFCFLASILKKRVRKRERKKSI